MDVAPQSHNWVIHREILSHQHRMKQASTFRFPSLFHQNPIENMWLTVHMKIKTYPKMPVKIPRHILKKTNPTDNRCKICKLNS